MLFVAILLYRIVVINSMPLFQLLLFFIFWHILFLQLAMINQYEVSQELSNAISDQANLTVVIDTTNPDKESYLMRSFSGEKLKVPPFVLKRKDVSKQSEADLIHLEIELMRKMVHPNLQMIRDVSICSYLICWC